MMIYIVVFQELLKLHFCHLKIFMDKIMKIILTAQLPLNLMMLKRSFSQVFSYHPNHQDLYVRSEI